VPARWGNIRSVRRATVIDADVRLALCGDEARENLVNVCEGDLDSLKSLEEARRKIRLGN
jgi:hypothetical protein